MRYHHAVASSTALVGNARSGGRSASIAARLFLAVALPAAAVVVLLGVLAWRTTVAAVEESLQRELAASVAVAAASFPASSIGTVRSLIREEEDSISARRVQGRLVAIQRSTRSSRVFILEPSTETVRAAAEPELHIGDPAPRVALDRAEIARALEKIPAVSVPFRGVDGRRYMAAYALLDGSREEPVAPTDAAPAPLVLAMEAPAGALDATDDVARRIAGLVSLAVLGVFSLALVVARTITRPLLRLAEDARRLGRGELKDALVPAPGTDEVAALGQTLESMRSALVDRDAERQMMLAGIAHEVRNPLGGMELFSGLLEEGIDELPGEVPPAVKQELKGQAGRVRRELSYLTDVVNSFLAFARDTPLHLEPVDVASLVEDVVSLCAREGSASLTLEAVGVGVVELDGARIKQALLNVVQNALAATPVEGRVRVTARREGRSLIIVVEDTGRGMSAETLVRIWQPFFTTKEKGSGLGMPLVRKLVRDHRGDVLVTSREGQGTTVTLTLPTARGSTDHGHDPHH